MSPESASLRLARAAEVDKTLGEFKTVDPEMLEILRKARILALTDDTVLITGPSGVGKEIIARAMHGNRPGDFLPLNCAAFSENLLESDLFGHEKGSFTDAKEKKVGALLSVGRGTVFLDEIDRMPIGIQSKLLRAIENCEVRPIGESKLYKISCRFVCSAKGDLLEKVRKHEFLPDLYGRIMTFRLSISPLSSRPEDIEFILRAMFKEAVEPEELERYLNIPPTYLPLIDLFNVRALISYVRHCVVFHEAPLK